MMVGSRFVKAESSNFSTIKRIGVKCFVFVLTIVVSRMSILIKCLMQELTLHEKRK